MWVAIWQDAMVGFMDNKEKCVCELSILPSWIHCHRTEEKIRTVGTGNTIRKWLKMYTFSNYNKKLKENVQIKHRNINKNYFNAYTSKYTCKYVSVFKDITEYGLI